MTTSKSTKTNAKTKKTTDAAKPSQDTTQQVAEVASSGASTEPPATPTPQQQTEEPAIRILKAATCPSLSGKSKLTYELGCNEASALHLRLTKNSGSGMFSKAWVSLEQLHGAIEKNKGTGKPITFATISPLFKGGSINTAGFVLAVLKHEGLVVAAGETPRAGYALGDPSRFLAEVQVLLNGGAEGTNTKKPAVRAQKVSTRASSKAAPGKTSSKAVTKAEAGSGQA